MEEYRNGSGNQDDLKVNIIVAAEVNRGIGSNGTLPWHLPAESLYYHTMINHVSPGKQNAVIIGRISYESVRDPKVYGNLLKVVVQRENPFNGPPEPNVRHATSFADAIKVIQKEKLQRDIENVWILGGARLYQETLDSPYLHRIYYTRVSAKFDCDTFFPEFDETNFTKVSDPRVPTGLLTDKGISYQVEVYERPRSVP